MASDNRLWHRQLEVGLTAAKKAMATILLIYRKGFSVKIKADNSPVTDADLASNKLIKSILNKAFPDYAILSEEDADNPERLNKEWVFIIDPLDGTEDFVHKDNQFCVNIGLVHLHRPVMGIVAIPYTGEIFYAYKDQGAFVVSDTDPTPHKIHVSDRDDDLIAVTSHFHTTPVEEDIYRTDPKVKGVLKVGSSIKSCLIAGGKADVAIKLGPGTKEWDTCAPQVLVTEAGGFFLTPDWTERLYDKPDVYNHDGYSIANKFSNLLSLGIISKKNLADDRKKAKGLLKRAFGKKR